MPKEDLVSFLENAAADSRLRARFRQRVSYADFQAIAKDRGFDLDDLSAGEAKQTIQIASDRSGETWRGLLPTAFYDQWPDRGR